MTAKTFRSFASCCLIAGAAIIAGLGCSPKNTEWPRGVASPVWSSYEGKEPVPGIDQASITCGLWSGRGMAVVVWTDVTTVNSEFLAPVTTKAEGFVFAGHHRGPNGRKVDCRCATRDGKTGTVAINGANYDLARGAIFLVSTTGAQTRVCQLERDTTKLEVDGFRELAKSDQEIRGFFTDAFKASKP